MKHDHKCDTFLAVLEHTISHLRELEAKLAEAQEQLAAVKKGLAHLYAGAE